jgi:hypothetical protein
MQQKQIVTKSQQSPELKPPSCSAPKFTNITNHSAKIIWTLNVCFFNFCLLVLIYNYFLANAY